MTIIGIVLWISMITLIILAFALILALRGQGAWDYILDIIAILILLLAGAIFASAFVSKSWMNPIHDAMFFGFGYSAAPTNPGYTPKPENASELDLAPIAGSDIWILQIELKPGKDGIIHLPQDAKVQHIECWTKNAQGTESLALTVK